MKPIILRIRIDDEHLRGLRSLNTGRRRCRTKASSKAMRRHLGRVIETELNRLTKQNGPHIELL